MKLLLALIAILFGSGCVTKARLNQHGLEQYSKGVSEAYQEFNAKTVKLLDEERAKTREAIKAGASVEAELRELRAKVDAFLKHPHTCAHKDLLK